MKNSLIIANWKLYPTLSDSLVLASRLKGELEQIKGTTVILAPPIPWLASVVEHWHHKTPNVKFAVQNIWPDDQGAFTGETSAFMVKSFVDYAIIGHSERRTYAHEDDELIREKIHSCLRWGIKPILCIGEQKRVMNAEGKIDSYQWQRLSNELMEALHGVHEDQLSSLVIAYEPVWAVGSHRSASSEYAETIIAKIRSRLAEKYTNGAVADLTILYGGSVTAESAADYLRSEQIDGLLIGEVSVKAKDFIHICRIAGHTK